MAAKMATMIGDGDVTNLRGGGGGYDFACTSRG